MSLAAIAPAQRSVLRWQTRMVVLWACTAGLLCSVFLLHRYAVQSMAIRYAANAAAMYFAGFLAGGYVCLRWWATRTPVDAHFPAEATPDDIALYHQEATEQRNHWCDFTRWWYRNSDDDDDDTDSRRYTLMERFLGWVLKILLGLILSLVATLAGLLFGYLPLVLAEALAGLLALVVLKFVVSAQTQAQYGAAPELGDYWAFVIGKTGLAALGCVAMAGAAGYWLEVRHPGATDLVDVVLPPILAYLPSSFPGDVPAFLASYLPTIVH